MNYRHIFAIQLGLYSLLLMGILPREFFLIWSVLLIPLLIKIGSRDSLLFFISSITTFIALPISYSFDSLSMWRPLIIFIALIFIYDNYKSLQKHLDFKNIFKSNDIKLLITLSLITIISIFCAEDQIGGIKRMIFFINLSIPAALVYLQAKIDNNFIKDALEAIELSLIAPLSFGIIQLISTYFLNIYDFIILWGENIQLRLYGRTWAETAIKANTWFAYFGDQLSLRMFSNFPDSHSFPIYLILALPALIFLGVKKISSKILSFIKEISAIEFCMISLLLLMSILSGTRGIWLAGFGILIISILHNTFIKKYTSEKILALATLSKNIGILFILLFAIAYPIFASSQFQVDKYDNDQIIIRIRSILDLEETSNNARLYIWERTLKSIYENPIIGVGLYNFPVVLKQDTELTKAGSSAHNIYLHLAAELGIPALIVILFICFNIIKKAYRLMDSALDKQAAIFATSFLLANIWIAIYSLTDFALFDERAFLLFLINIALINILYKKHANTSK